MTRDRRRVNNYQPPRAARMLGRALTAVDKSRPTPTENPRCRTDRCELRLGLSTAETQAGCAGQRLPKGRRPVPC